MSPKKRGAVIAELTAPHNIQTSIQRELCLVYPYIKSIFTHTYFINSGIFTIYIHWHVTSDVSVFVNEVLVPKHHLFNHCTVKNSSVRERRDITKSVLHSEARLLSLRNDEEDIVTSSAHCHIDDVLVVYMRSLCTDGRRIQYNEHDVAFIALETMHSSA